MFSGLVGKVSDHNLPTRRVSTSSHIRMCEVHCFKVKAANDGAILSIQFKGSEELMQLVPRNAFCNLFPLPYKVQKMIASLQIRILFSHLFAMPPMHITFAARDKNILPIVCQRELQHVTYPYPIHA